MTIPDSHPNGLVSSIWTTDPDTTYPLVRSPLWIPIPMESKDVLQILVRSQSIQVLYISVAIAGRSSQSAAAQEEGNG